MIDAAIEEVDRILCDARETRNGSRIVRAVLEAMPDSLTRLRAATEDDVARALTDAYVKLDAPAVDLLEFFNRMLDVVGLET